MLSTVSSVLALAAMLMVGHASAADYAVTIRPGLVYANHDGTNLVGDFYLPKGRTAAPALVALHGGGWQAGGRDFYQYWGPFLARNGYALFAADYRLGKSGIYPAAVYDAKAAIQFVRAKAAEFDIDPNRIGLMGDSAGAQLAALLALAGDQFNSAYRDDPYAATPINVKAVIDNITEEFLGVSPAQNRQIYFDSAPISFAAVDRSEARFLLVSGGRDKLVDPASQSGAFYTRLSKSGFFVRRVINPDAGHFWASEPFENSQGGYSAIAVLPVLRFLNDSL
jgi:acetyl esterase/lipase